MRHRIFHADHLLPCDAPPIRDGAVVVDSTGEIVAVGASAEIVPSYAGSPVERVRGVVFPGLVNAHTHIELSSMRGKVPGGRGFIPWVDRLVTLRVETTPDEDLEGISAGVAELVRSGTVAIGDVSNALSAVAALAAAGIGGYVFHEVFGTDPARVETRIRGLAAEREERWPHGPSEDLRYAPAPHTLFTLHPEAARTLLSSAQERGGITSLHLAEHPAERRAIERGEGPVVGWFAQRLSQSPTFPKVPLFDLAESVGALRPGVLLVHLADARPDELARVARSGASVVLCPRSNLHIEGRLPPLLAVREAGIQAGLGTDSLASNASLDVLAEARALADRFPSVPAWELVAMATWNGAQALGRPDLGRIARGARPGLYAIDGEVASAADPASFVLAHLSAERRLLAGRAVPPPLGATPGKPS